MPAFLDKDPPDHRLQNYGSSEPSDTDRADGLLQNVVKKLSRQKKDSEPDTQEFIQKMINYLEKKQVWILFYCNLEDVTKRVGFISGVVNIMLLKDLAAQINTLSEDKIITFKGYFFKELYGLLKNQRLSFKEKESLIQKSTSFPGELVGLVAEYANIRLIRSNQSNNDIKHRGEKNVTCQRSGM